MEQDKQNNDNLGSDDINSFNSDAASSMFDDSIQAGGSMFDGPNQGDDSTSMFGEIPSDKKNNADTDISAALNESNNDSIANSDSVNNEANISDNISDTVDNIDNTIDEAGADSATEEELSDFEDDDMDHITGHEDELGLDDFDNGNQDSTSETTKPREVQTVDSVDFIDDESLNQTPNIKNNQSDELITVRPVKFKEFEPTPPNRSIKKNLDIMQDVLMHVTVELGRTKSSIKEVIEMEPGSIVELDKIAGEQVEVYVNERLVAKGEVIVIEDKFGVRITSTSIPKALE